MMLVRDFHGSWRRGARQVGTGGRPARARQEGAPRAGPPGLRDAAPHFLKPVSCGRTRPLRRPPPPGPGPHRSGEAPRPAAALTALLLHVPPPDARPGPVTTRRPARTAPASRLAGAHSGATPASPRAGAPPRGVSSRLRSFCRPGGSPVLAVGPASCDHTGDVGPRDAENSHTVLYPSRGEWGSPRWESDHPVSQHLWPTRHVLWTRG